MLTSSLLSLSEASFPRMGQLLVDYDVPIKMLPEEFAPHCKVWRGGVGVWACGVDWRGHRPA